MAQQGKCDTCKIRYYWRQEIPIRYMRCPKCKNGLQTTSCQLKNYPSVKLD